ncbi:unnamed protein product [Cuscuta epithymum]|uniref:Carboxypeptidase n=1 Tax=Cuscuta epithymum TaxID=186058 RepID=A0AAV0CE26_9ASTE|nr:unnamed protein product [Cuscuta epithymum]
MAEATTLLLTSSLLFLLVSLRLPSSTAAEEDDGLSVPSSNNPRYPIAQVGENLIRQLNLFPGRHDHLRKEGGEAVPVDEPRLIEKRLELDYLGKSDSTLANLGHHAGYVKLRHTKDANMFYFFFESRGNRKSDPVVIWLTGGPGCSSELALFYENGPFQIQRNLSLTWNDYGWDKISNLIYVDQPTGTGFSYSSDQSDTRHDENGISNDLYDFLQAFFEKHPEYVENDFFITGESYAGHYIPAFASRVNEGNKMKEGIHINLKGFAIGNGLTDPSIQYSAYTDYALEQKLINKSDYYRINKDIPACQAGIKTCGTEGGDACQDAFYTCTKIFNEIRTIIGDKNFYDIRKTCDGPLCYDFSNMETYLNTKGVRKALGVGNIDFVSCNSDVYEAMILDWMRNLEAGIPTLLEDGINMLIYAGEYDLICNWLGNSRWVHAMEWPGQKNFGIAPNVSFTVDGKVKGTQKSYGPLTFLKVNDAGHMVPMDQPKAALVMLQRWMQGKLTATASPM